MSQAPQIVLHPVVLLWSMSCFIEASCRETAQYSIFTSLFAFGDTRRLDSPERKAASVGPRQRSRASGASGGATSARLERNGAKLAIVFFCGFFQCPNDVPSFFLTFWGVCVATAVVFCTFRRPRARYCAKTQCPSDVPDHVPGPILLP